jgi:hypothetical protein
MLEDLVRIYSGIQTFNKDSLSNLLTLLRTNAATTSVAPLSGIDISERTQMLDSDSEETFTAAGATQPARKIDVSPLIAACYANTVSSSLRRIISFQIFAKSAEGGEIKAGIQWTRGWCSQAIELQAAFADTCVVRTSRGIPKCVFPNHPTAITSQWCYRCTWRVSTSQHCLLLDGHIPRRCTNQLYLY